MSSRTRSSLLNISTGIVGQLLTLFVSFGVRAVFIYELGATYLGISGLFGNILSLLSFTELGFGQAIIFALYKPIAQGDEAKVGALMALFRKVYRWMFWVVAALGLSITPFLCKVACRNTVLPFHIYSVRDVVGSLLSLCL
jgi:hypothetical protein